MEQETDREISSYFDSIYTFIRLYFDQSESQSSRQTCQPANA